jgi:hypothetical protein
MNVNPSEMSVNTTRLDYALAFASAGFHLHPCKQDKKPYLDSWPDKATTDIQQLRSWADEFPGCRWGVAAGKSGLVIVDSDIKENKRGEDTLVLLQADNGALPDTYTVRTPSGGVHRYFKGLTKTAAQNLGPALDTRSVGGYAIIPDGVDYVPLNQAPIAEAPKWVIDKAGKPGEKERSKDADIPAPGVEIDKAERVLDAIEYVTKQAPGASVGNRDDTTYRVACCVRDFGLSYHAALKIMTDYWAERQDVELTSDFDPGHVRWKVEQAYKTAKNKLGENLPEAVFSAIPSNGGGFVAYDAGKIDERIIPKREWLLGTWFLKKFLTVTVAPGGTGKSNLSIIEALALVTGREISGDYVHEKGNVWLHNGEDPLDEIERRVAAACKVHKVKQHEILGRFFYTSGRTNPIVLVKEAGRNMMFVDEAAITAVKKFIIDNDIKLWIIDPFVDMHDVNENDNGPINKVAKILSAIAGETGCSIHVVHHTRKKSKDGGLTDMDMARGASALLSAARIGRNLNGMSDKDAQNFILPSAPHWYVRLDSSKANLSSPTDHTQWFEKISVELSNGDGVGTLKPVDLERTGTGDKNDTIRQRVVELVDEHGGMIGVNEAATSLAQEGELGLKRTALIDRIKKKAFAHPYVTQDGVGYVLVHASPGDREGWSVVRRGEGEK